MSGSSEKNVPLELPPELGAKVDGLLADDKYYDAIKLVRKETGVGLGIGTRIVDHRKEAGASS